MSPRGLWPQVGVSALCPIPTARFCASLLGLSSRHAHSSTAGPWPEESCPEGLLPAWLLCAQAQSEPCRDQAGPAIGTADPLPCPCPHNHRPCLAWSCSHLFSRVEMAVQIPLPVQRERTMQPGARGMNPLCQCAPAEPVFSLVRWGHNNGRDLSGQRVSICADGPG